MSKTTTTAKPAAQLAKLRWKDVPPEKRKEIMTKIAKRPRKSRKK